MLLGLRRETKEFRLHIETVDRAMKYEVKILMEKEDSLLFEILRRKELKIGEENSKTK